MVIRNNHSRKHLYSPILSNISTIMLLGSGLTASPLLYILTDFSEAMHVIGFIIPSACLGFIGLFIWQRFRGRQKHALSFQDASVVVLLSWLIVCLFSAIPFMYSLKLTFTQAFFETVSGYTTTGLSVIDVEHAPRIILLWRSIMQFTGGAGLAIIMLAAIAGPVGTGLHFAEGRSQQLAPHVKESAKLVVSIYCGYLIAGVIAYLVVGLGFFDALNHAMAAISTGGFATHSQSIGYWDSAAVEAVTISLMLIGNLNFLTAYYLLHGNFRVFVRNGEVKLMAILLPFGFLLLATLVCPVLYPHLGKALRVALFEATSALTTTGFSTVSYGNWNATGFLLLILFMLIGGGTCSTAGGLKQYRVYIMVKSIFWEIRRNFLPKNAVIENYTWYGDRKDYMTDDRIRQIMVFAFVYIATFFLGALVLTIGGYELQDSMFEFASALGTVGLSIGVTSPETAPYVLWTLTIAMFMGRLEFFVIFVSIRKLAEKLLKMYAHA